MIALFNPAKEVLVFLLVFFLSFGVNKAQEKEQESEIVLPEVLVPGERREGSYIEEEASTATKTDTPIQDIPQSLEVIDRELIDDQGAVQLQDTVYNVSGVVPGDSFLMPFLILFGNAGKDTLEGGSSADELFGGGGSDTLRGGDADDKLNGGSGRDTCDGGNHINGDTATSCETVTNVP